MSGYFGKPLLKDPVLYFLESDFRWKRLCGEKKLTLQTLG